METKPKKYKMLKTVAGSRDGIKVEQFLKGEIYELDESLAEQFYDQGGIDEVGANAKVNPADARETKVTGPSESKIVSPSESKEGEAGVNLDTQNIEELVATARDHYGLEVDSTMSEADVRRLIEDASGDTEDDHPAKKATKTEKGHK